MVHKAVACVIRDGPAGPELLVFTHPTGTVQIPKGTIEPDESPGDAVLRELEEESGLRNVSVVSTDRELARSASRGADGVEPGEPQIWHVFRLRPAPGTPETWQHEAHGSAEEVGLVFDFHWVPLTDARATLHPLFHPVVDALDVDRV